MSVSAEAFKGAMARWASGVTIVTARAGDEVHGMTASDFCGVSLDPLLVLVCASKSSETHGVIARGRCFCVNILAQGQQALSNRFASKREEHRRFEGLECATAKTGAPLIPGACASFDCALEAAHDAGDHEIYVGRVLDIVVGEGEPLLYHRGAYGRFSEAADPSP
ncbi:MAG: flavin reductase family protein [Proteobacteria bacterium]|nr:flavin reductase family protein [Pseudomonadota bacterium]